MNLPLNLLVAVATIAGAGAASAQTVYIQEQPGTETIVSDPVAVTPVQRTTVYRNIIPQGGGLAPIVRERIVTERFAPVAPLAREQVVVVPRDTTYGYGTREAAYYDYGTRDGYYDVPARTYEVAPRNRKAGPRVRSANGITAIEARCRGTAPSPGISPAGKTSASGTDMACCATGRAGVGRAGAAGGSGTVAWRDFAERQANPSVAQSCPSLSNSRAVAARCSSPSRSRPRAASACSSARARRIEGRQREPGFQGRNRSSRIGLRDAMFQQRHVAGAEAVALRGQPGVERGAAVDLQPFEKLAREQTRTARAGARPGLLRCLLRPPGRSRSHRPASREIQPHRVAARIDARPAGRIDQPADLAQAPAQLAARVLRHVPQQLAQLAAWNGARRQGEIGDERAHLARCRQRERRPRRGGSRAARAGAVRAPGSLRSAPNSTRVSTPAPTPTPTRPSLGSRF